MVYKLLHPSQVNSIVGAVGGGAASRYVSSSDQMMRDIKLPMYGRFRKFMILFFFSWKTT
jgi:hypothetical protein